MRVSTKMMFNQGLNALQRQQNAMAEAQKEISSGRKNLDPAKDPVGYATASNLEISNKRLAQYERNIDFARGKLELQEGVLANATETLQRVKEISIEASNSLKLGEAGSASRQALRDELAGLRESLMSQANTRDERGEYVFSGTQSATAPYDAVGAYGLAPTAGSVNVQVAEGQDVEVYRTAGGVFNDGADSIMQVIDQLDTAIAAGNMADIATAQDRVDNVFDKVVTARGQIGNALSTLDRAFEDNDAQKYANQKALSDLRDTDYADAITRLNMSMTTMQATQQTISKTQSLSLFNFIG
ncbi:MAG: flagellar hook-associated protein FlgL [Halothiobacillaceae bacterium]